jgi:hypothetical protein
MDDVHTGQPTNQRRTSQQHHISRQPPEDNAVKLSFPSFCALCSSRARAETCAAPLGTLMASYAQGGWPRWRFGTVRHGRNAHVWSGEVGGSGVWEAVVVKGLRLLIWWDQDVVSCWEDNHRRIT